MPPGFIEELIERIPASGIDKCSMMLIAKIKSNFCANGLLS